MGERILITGGSGFIGTHLIDLLMSEENKWDIINIDKQKPLKEEHSVFWKEVNILDNERLSTIIKTFEPKYVVHLAANGGVTGTSLEDYIDNTTGTQNVIEAVKNCTNTKRIIVTSSQVVCKPGYIPKSDTDFCPTIPYAESKVITEKITREANLSCEWIIIRPSYIWGPYHPRNADEILKTIDKRWYIHPSGKPVIRSYGYVKNVAWQMHKLLTIEPDKVNKKVFYVSDMPIDFYNWVNALSVKLTNHKVRVLPRQMLKLMALLGDIVSKVIGKPFYINSYRYYNMTQENIIPINQTFDILGTPPYTLEQGVGETIAWVQEKWIADNAIKND